MTQQAILIAGMHRSGTSAFSRIINLLGADLGPPGKMVKPGYDNPEGFWEHEELMRMNDEVLTAIGQDWHKTDWYGDDWLERVDWPRFSDKINMIMERDFGQSPLWAVKDPRLCLTLPLWKKVLAERGTGLTLFMPVRHPVEVASSLAKREEIPVETGLAIWLRHNLKLAQAAVGVPGLILTYERLMDDPSEAIRQAATFLSLPAKGERISTALDSLRPQLRNNRAMRSKAMPPAVKALWELFKAREGKTFEPGDKATLDAICGELDLRQDLAMPRNMRWIEEFDTSAVGTEATIRRVAVSLPVEPKDGGNVRFCPTRTSGFFFMRNPVLLADAPAGLREGQADLQQTKDVLWLDKNRGAFVALSESAEVCFAVSTSAGDVGDARLAFDYSFQPLPRHYCRYFAELAHSKVWRLAMFARKVKRWLKIK